MLASSVRRESKNTFLFSVDHSSSGSPLPLYEVVTTNYGWTTSEDKNFSRRILSGEFFNAVLAHPNYNASAWSDLEQTPNPNRTILAFLDLDTCLEFNYPIYGVKWWHNAEPGRTSGGGYLNPLKESCLYIVKAAASQALLANPKSRLIILDCSGWIKHSLRRQCGASLNEVISNKQIIFAHYSRTKAEVRHGIDVGLPAPAIKPVNLGPHGEKMIRDCSKRKWLFSFQGRGGNGREGLLQTDDHKGDVYIRILKQRSYKNDIQVNATDTNNYSSIMTNSIFSGSPRGDALYTHRFAEVMSAGAVPVVYANNWHPPFNDNVVNWTNCAVFIPESDMNKTVQILRAISNETRCEMQKCALEVWHKYMASRSGWLDGLINAALPQRNRPGTI